ncbi:hypothetical protein, partial [Pseudomonas syringae]|uniref:hypothetical protein n=1 Tax=Pseudomonas syringae TaxID=317 RepID=UPI001E42C7B8
ATAFCSYYSPRPEPANVGQFETLELAIADPVSADPLMIHALSWQHSNLPWRLRSCLFQYREKMSRFN